MAKELTPLGDRVVVKPLTREEVTKSGIVLPDTAREKPQEGEVLAVGPGRVLDNGQRQKVELNKGDNPLRARRARRTPDLIQALRDQVEATANLRA